MNNNQIAKLKYIWAYMIIEGRITTGEFDYYGGRFESLWLWPARIEKEAATKEDIGIKINTIGVDWAASGVPEYRNESEFTDTYTPSVDIECLLGTLVLNDGSKYTLGVAKAKQEYIDAIELFDKEIVALDYVNRIFKD